MPSPVPFSYAPPLKAVLPGAAAPVASKGPVPFKYVPSATPSAAPAPVVPVAAANLPGPRLGQGFLGNLAGNAVRTVLEPLNRGGVIQKGLDQTLGRVGNAIAGNGFFPTNTGQAAATESKVSAQNHAGGVGGAIGDVIGTVAPYLIPVGGEAAIAERAATLVPKVATAIGSKATSLIPRAVGFAVRNAPTVARDAAIGTAQTGSPIEGTAIGLGGAAIKGTIDAGVGLTKAVSKLGLKGGVAESIYGKNTSQLTQTLADTYNKIPLPKGVMQEEAHTGKSFADFMASKPHLSIGVKDGRFDTFDTAQTLRAEVKPEAEALSSLLENSQAHISENTMIGQMKKSVEQVATGQERKGVQEFIEREIPILVDQFSNRTVNAADGSRTVPVADWNKIKQTLWDRSPFKPTASRADNLKSSVDYALGKVIKNNIERAVPDADVQGLNSELGDYYHAIETLENLHGGPAPKGRMGMDFARIAGAVAGSPGGTIGSVAGYFTADRVAQFLSNPELTTALKREALTQLKVSRPTVASQVADILKKQAAEQASRPLLPEAPIKMGGTDSLGRKVDAGGSITSIPQEGMRPSAHYMYPNLNRGLALPAGNNAIRLPEGKGITTPADQAVFERNAAGIKTESPQQQLRYYLDILGRE